MSKKILLFENVTEDFMKYRFSYAMHLLNQGFEVHAFIPCDNEFNFSNKAIDKFIVHQYPYERNDLYILSFFRVLFQLIKVLRSYQIDILHSYRFYCNTVSSVASIFCRVNFVATITGLGIAYSMFDFKSRVLKFISSSVYNFIYLTSNHIFFQNPDDINDIFLSFLWSNKNYSIVNGSGVDLDMFSRKGSHPIDFRNKYFIPKDSIVFTCVTRIIYEKGIIELLEAFRKLSISNPSLTLILAGWPDFNNPRCIPVSLLEQYSEIKNIIIAGKIQDIPSLLASSDVFVFPSYYREGIPRSILEALSSSLPVITTDMPGCKETVKPNVNGLIIQPRSVDSLVSAIIEILGFDLVKMGEHSRQMAVEKFSANSIYSSMINCYV